MGTHKTITSERDGIPDWAPSEARPLTGEPTRFENGMSWEMDESGHHRIVDADGQGGEWSGYAYLARSTCGNYIAATQCFEGIMPCEVLIRIEVMAEAS